MFCVSPRIGNAPCSWGVEFPDAPENPPWESVLEETAAAGYAGTELGPVGYVPEDPEALAERLDRLGLSLVGGVVFQPFHDPSAWDAARASVERTCRMLAPLGARHLVLIDSIAGERAKHAGDHQSAPRLQARDAVGLHGRLTAAARIAAEEYGLLASLHHHAGGFVEFQDEIERAMDALDPRLVGLCLDTGHSLYGGLDPVQLLRSHSARLRYVHLKDLDKRLLRASVRERVGFYEACNRGVFCRLGRGDVDFAAFFNALGEVGYRGWCTVEQDRGPDTLGSPLDDARANRRFLASQGFAG